jgi:hypothetical protein
MIEFSTSAPVNSGVRIIVFFLALALGKREIYVHFSQSGDL